MPVMRASSSVFTTGDAIRLRTDLEGLRDHLVLEFGPMVVANVGLGTVFNDKYFWCKDLGRCLVTPRNGSTEQAYVSFQKETITTVYKEDEGKHEHIVCREARMKTTRSCSEASVPLR